jgi:hypothetical protein
MVRGLNSAAEGDLDWMGEFAKGMMNSFVDFVTLTDLFRFSTAVLDVVIVQIPRVWQRHFFERA